MVERLIREIRRREKVIGMFPNLESALRLIGARIVERDGGWISDKRCLDMEDHRERSEPENEGQDRGANQIARWKVHDRRLACSREVLEYEEIK